MIVDYLYLFIYLLLWLRSALLFSVFWTKLVYVRKYVRHVWQPTVLSTVCSCTMVKKWHAARMLTSYCANAFSSQRKLYVRGLEDDSIALSVLQWAPTRKQSGPSNHCFECASVKTNAASNLSTLIIVLNVLQWTLTRQTVYPFQSLF